MSDESRVDSQTSPESSWEKAYEEEFKKILERRQVAFGAAIDTSNSSKQKKPQHLAGLALSGGGIRSALFNDGFLQAISHAGLLRYIDYLSSVSGGGYIAGHLVASGIKKREVSRSEQPDGGQVSSGNLAGSAAVSKSFHDDDRFFPLGKDPATGKADRHRLDNAGNYLSDRLSLYSRFLATQVFTIALYLGVAGIFGTLIALIWRSLDYTEFRQVTSALQLDAGDELMIAFMPCVVLLTIFFIWTMVRVTVCLFPPERGAKYQVIKRMWISGNRVLFTVAAMTSLIASAVFLGNGFTHTRVVSANEDQESSAFFLNHFAQILAVTAGVIQVLVFFGRDRLFKSEQSDARSWQHRAVKFISFSSVMFAVFAMVHWMSRENISAYVNDRDQHLVRAEVLQWDQLEHVITQSGSYLKIEPPALLDSELKKSQANLDKYLYGAVRQLSDWQRQQTGTAFGLPFLETQKVTTATPPSPFENPNSANGESDDGSGEGKTFVCDTRLDDRALALRCWWLLEWMGRSVSYEFISGKTFAPDATDEDGKEREQQMTRYFLPADTHYNGGDKSLVDDRVNYPKKAGREELRKYLFLMGEDWKAKDEFLVWTNQYLLESPEFAKWLVKRIEAGPEESQPKRPVNKPERSALEDSNDHNGDLREIVKESLFGRQVPDVDVNSLLHSIALLDSGEFKRRLTPQQKKSIVKLNRDLLSVQYPEMLRSRRIVSTPIVIRHDQAARWRWLATWFFVLAIGVIGTWKLNWQMPFFHYYRRMLTEKFLLGWMGRSHTSTDFDLTRAAKIPEDYASVHQIDLAEADVTDVGLPYPMWLGCHLRGIWGNGDFSVHRESFLFTPKYIGVTDRESESIVETENYLFHRRFITVQMENQRRGSQSDENPNIILTPFKLSDAVAISGSALTPFMTNNFYLMLMMDFFGVRLGQWLPHPNARQRPPTMKGSYCWILREFFRSNWSRKQVYDTPPGRIPWDYGFIADGGYVDNLGVIELLRRRCKLVIVSDCGVNTDVDELGQLAKMLADARNELGVEFLDLDHDGPIDFGRLQRDEKRLVPQPYLCFRIRYPENDAAANGGYEPPVSSSFIDDDENTGYLIYVQMAITEGDPLEIRQIRKRFRTFPDDPTTNQFYTEAQVEAYRRLGYYIGQRICRELTRWNTTQIADGAEQELGNFLNPKLSPFFGDFEADNNREAAKQELRSGRQPLFTTVCRRLIAGYRMACFEEISYREHDVLSEALWDQEEWCFASFKDGANELSRFFAEPYCPIDCHLIRRVCDRWIGFYEENADIRAAYRNAAFTDVNRAMISTLERSVNASLNLNNKLAELVGTKLKMKKGDMAIKRIDIALQCAHFAVVAVACHQLHRGTPHAIFQVGGRQKLIDLVISMFVRETPREKETTPTSAISPDDVPRPFQKPEKRNWQAWLKNACPEIIEMRRCVFQDAEMLTVVSFFHTLVMQCLKQNVPKASWLFGPEQRKSAKRAIRNDEVSDLRKIIDAAQPTTSSRSRKPTAPSKSKRAITPK